MITNHRAEAERMLADAREWARQAGELSPKASERACLAHAQVHALLAIHDTLTAADRYAANEAKQREATQEAAGGDLSAPEGESGAEGGGEAEEAAEPLLCVECGHDIDEHNGDPDAPGEWCAGCDDCRLTPSTIARALIEQAVEDERESSDQGSTQDARLGQGDQGASLSGGGSADVQPLLDQWTKQTGGRRG